MASIWRPPEGNSCGCKKNLWFYRDLWGGKSLFWPLNIFVRSLGLDRAFCFFATERAPVKTHIQTEYNLKANTGKTTNCSIAYYYYSNCKNLDYRKSTINSYSKVKYNFKHTHTQKKIGCAFKGCFLFCRETTVSVMNYKCTMWALPLGEAGEVKPKTRPYHVLKG